MKIRALSSVAGLLLIASHTVCAGEIPSSDIEVISALPRSPDVKPLAMSVPSDGPHQSAVFPVGKSNPLYSATGKMANETGSKSLPSAKGEKQQR